jgi:hypothetical protein
MLCKEIARNYFLAKKDLQPPLKINLSPGETVKQTVYFFQ